MDEKSAKKLYSKMKSDNMLPDFFSGVWDKDKSKFIRSLVMDEKIGITHVDTDDFEFDNFYGDGEF